jgi:hypothetical protein
MLIKSLVLILVNDSISGNKNGRAASTSAKQSKEEEKRKKIKTKNRYKGNSMCANYPSNSFNELSLHFYDL